MTFYPPKRKQPQNSDLSEIVFLPVCAPTKIRSNYAFC